MKKIYVKPSTEVYEVELQNVIADSPDVEMTSESTTGDGGSDAGERPTSWGSLW
jgi:hypothetical protein